MTQSHAAQLLRIFVGEADKLHGRPLYEVIVAQALEARLAGATVLRGILGFGAHGEVHSAKVLRLSEDLPMVIEIVDIPERINSFLAASSELLADVLVTISPVQALDRRE